MKHILSLNESAGPKKPRSPHSEGLAEILDVVLAMLVRSNQGERNLIEFLEEKLIQIALEEATNNKTRASKSLGIERKRLERRVKKYQYAASRPRPRGHDETGRNPQPCP